MKSATISSPSLFQIYLNEVNGTPLLSDNEVLKLAERIEQGDPEARDHMTRANLRLVVNVARGFLGRGLHLEELVAEGNLGLMRAVEAYDRSLGIKFSTYASYWIKHSVRRALANGREPMRLPYGMPSRLSKWRRAKSTLASQLGRDPTNEEVGCALGWSKNRIKTVTTALRAADLARFETDTPLDGFVLDTSKPIDEQVEDADNVTWLRKRLGCLDERRRTAVTLRFGLSGLPPMSYDEVGKHFDCSGATAAKLVSEGVAQLVPRDNLFDLNPLSKYMIMASGRRFSGSATGLSRK